MKRPVVMMTLVFFAVAQLLMCHPVFAQAEDGVAVTSQYIVVMKKGVNVQSFLASGNISPKYLYTTAFHGFAATLTTNQLNALRRSPYVALIEPDRLIGIQTTQSVPAGAWGLDRIDQRNLPLSGTYTYSGTGSGVNAYIIGTGIATAHPEFGGRAVVAYDALGGNGQDCNGSGTYAAGIVGAATWGVAKRVTLRSVRVLDCTGVGSTATIIAGINWVTSNHVKPAVAHIAFGGSASSALNTAVTSMINAGVFTAVAAGNSASNACNYSPGSTPGAYTTAASSATDTVSSSSNSGSCVDGYAPGVSITSTWLNGGTATLSGTTGASAHVAGVAALYKGYGDASSDVVTTWINANATMGVLSGVPPSTPNRLLYKAAL